ncbi:uncharacterized protein LOC131149539 isoform X5 [Malania oleifera]|uniref:uncharacterized protein LOC131149539 isoform X5 n=1 Tax=Malania oleifera TaxID=397392 RepID=UPI0025ADFC41|nr:uncharacterized protein LOC131149539 isoform X5 [Malania oleifera]
MLLRHHHSFYPFDDPSLFRSLISSYSPPTLSSSVACSCWVWEILQAASWGLCISFSFCFLQYVVHLGSLYRSSSTSIISSDPGVVKDETSHTDKLVGGSVSEVEAQCEELEPSAGGILHEDLAEESTISRVRYCRSCKAYIKGFDHHCPAFGNCIGQKNHVLFMVLLVGFVITETSYVVCCFQFATQARVFDKTGLESGLSGNLSISTMLFSLLQVLWQVVFLAWHIYCVCVNIKTEEWINWKNYPEFQLSIQPQPGNVIFHSTIHVWPFMYLFHPIHKYLMFLSTYYSCFETQIGSNHNLTHILFTFFWVKIYLD